MQSLLSRATRADVSDEPFPHVVVRDALDEDLCSELMASFPSLDEVARGRELASNRRLGVPAAEVFADSSISPAWQEFVRLHTSGEFLREITDLFGDHIRRHYDALEDELGDLSSLRAGVHGVDSYDSSDVLLEAQPSVNTPVVGAPSSVRRIHVDNPQKLFAGLYYLRLPEDDSTGGDLELHSFKRGEPHGFNGVYVNDRFADPVKKVEYGRNVFVLLLNSVHSLHGVTVRSTTQHPRCFANLFVEVGKPLFDVEQHQVTLSEKLMLAPQKAAEYLRRPRAA